MRMLTAELGPAGAPNAKDGNAGHGVYLLTGTMNHIGQSGQQRLTLTLEDATGRITGVVWPEARASVRCPATLPAPVIAHATLQCYDSKPQLKVHSLTVIDRAEVTRATALLPRQRCPEVALAALARLADLEQILPPPLDGFLREVLLDPQITLPFLRCRASVAHHHAFQGGLLVHSTEMLDLAATITQRILPDDPWSPYLAQLGYLFHDLGKLRSVGEVRRPAYAMVVPHEQLTLELLAPHLRWLELRNPDLATGLRYLFGYLATPARARPVPEHVVAEVVATLDQWSAARHSQRDLDHLLGKTRSVEHASPRGLPTRFLGRHQPGAHHATA